MNSIFARASVRSFDGRKVESEKVELLLKAAMAAPSACNQQPWEFVVVTDPDVLKELSGCSPYAGCIGRAPLGIVVCMRTEGLRAPDYAQIDASAATENLLLEAVELGLGAVWLGIAPGLERMEAVRRVIGAPETVQPFGLVACGCPDKPVSPANRYDPARVHYEKW
ncbi:MAG: nitroreductase family protein [Oscillibacter sp.]|nr:nitroreductase family protein [Oscillibacter sp.]